MDADHKAKEKKEHKTKEMATESRDEPNAANKKTEDDETIEMMTDMSDEETKATATASSDEAKKKEDKTKDKTKEKTTASSDEAKKKKEDQKDEKRDKKQGRKEMKNPKEDPKEKKDDKEKEPEHARTDAKREKEEAKKTKEGCTPSGSGSGPTTPRKRLFDEDTPTPKKPRNVEDLDSVPVEIDPATQALTSVYQRYFCAAAELLDSPHPEVRAATILIRKGHPAIQDQIKSVKKAAQKLINAARCQTQTITFLRERNAQLQEKIELLEAQLALKDAGDFE